MNREWQEQRRREQASEQEQRRGLNKDDVVCVTGIGMDNVVHRHEQVLRVTKTLVVTRTRDGAVSHRFGIEDGRSKPYTPYGGTKMHLTCKKKGS